MVNILQDTPSRKVVRFLMRFPLFLIFLALLIVESALYWTVRLVVIVVEAVFGRRDFSPRTRELHEKRINANSFREYQEICKQLDEHEGRAEWRHIAENPHYDSRMIQRTTAHLRKLREGGDPLGLMQNFVLSKNFGGIMNRQLYTKTWSGTKHAIDEYVREVVCCLEYISMLDTEDPVLIRYRKRFFAKARAEFGNTALSLSGGAMNGTYHLGIIKALADVQRLPKILSGTSAGAVMGAFVAVRTDKELVTQLAETAYVHSRLSTDGPFPGTLRHQIEQLMKNGVVYGVKEFEQSIKNVIKDDDCDIPGDITFKEAHDRTGRTLVIPCTPAKSEQVRGSPTIMFSHHTAPDVPIVHAVVASCTVPLVLNSIAVMEKVIDKDLIRKGPAGPGEAPGRQTAPKSAGKGGVPRASGGQNGPRSGVPPLDRSLTRRERYELLSVAEMQPSESFRGGALEQSLSDSFSPLVQYKTDKFGEYLYKPFLAPEAAPAEVQSQEANQTEGHIDEGGVVMRDGTLASDIPTAYLWQTFNVKFTLVSQVNPHVVPFFFNGRGEPGKPVKPVWGSDGWRANFFLSFLETFIKHDMLKNLRVMSHYRLFIDSLGVDWSTIYNQDFGGDLTLAPPLTVADYCSLIWNLTDDKHGLDLLRHRVHVGETICWKALPMFKNRMDIQVALNKALTRLRFQPSKTTLH